MTQQTETAIRKAVSVRSPVEDAFRIFTEGLGSWWPVQRHSVRQEQAETAVLEGGVGGRLYERAKDGEELLWGTVLVWEPPTRLVVTWHPGRAEETSQELELRFTPEEGGTRVELEHRGWERLAEQAEAFARYEGGWDYVLECYAGAATGAGAGT